MINKMTIELTTIYDDGDMIAKVYQNMENSIYYKYSSVRGWVINYGKLNNKMVSAKKLLTSNNDLLVKMQQFFNSNKDNIVSSRIIFE